MHHYYSLMSLPLTVLSLIWTALDPPSRNPFSLACKLFREVHLDAVTGIRQVMVTLCSDPDSGSDTDTDSDNDYGDSGVHYGAKQLNLITHFLTSYPRLRHLDVGDFKVLPHQISDFISGALACGFPMGQLQSLRFSQLSYAKSDDANIALLMERLTGLKSFEQDACSSDTLEPHPSLALLSGLTTLKLNNYDMKEGTLDRIISDGRFPHLVTFDISSGRDVSSSLIRTLTALSSLETLIMNNITFADPPPNMLLQDFEHAFVHDNGLSKMVRLDLKGVCLDFSDMELLTGIFATSPNLRNLQHINLHEWPNSKMIVALALENRSWPSLKSAVVWSHRTTWPHQQRLADALRAATYLTSLQTLTYDSESLTDQQYGIDAPQDMNADDIQAAAQATRQLMTSAPHLSSLNSLGFQGTHPEVHRAFVDGLLAATQLTSLSDIQLDAVPSSQMLALFCAKHVKTLCVDYRITPDMEQLLKIIKANEMINVLKAMEEEEEEHFFDREEAVSFILTLDEASFKVVLRLDTQQQLLPQMIEPVRVKAWKTVDVQWVVKKGDMMDKGSGPAQFSDALLLLADESEDDNL